MVRRPNSFKRSKCQFKLPMMGTRNQMCKPSILKRMVIHFSTIVSWKRVSWRPQVSKIIFRIGVSTNLCLITMSPMFRSTTKRDSQGFINQQATKKRDKTNTLEVLDKVFPTNRCKIKVCCQLLTRRWRQIIPKLWTLLRMGSLQTWGALQITTEAFRPGLVPDSWRIIGWRSLKQRTTWWTKITWSQSLTTPQSTWCLASKNRQTTPRVDQAGKRI